MNAPAASTASAPAASSVPRVGRGFRLQFEKAQDCHVLLYPEGMVRLNPSAGEILRRCDGTRSVSEIVADLEQAFATTGLGNDVLGFLEVAARQRWVEFE